MKIFIIICVVVLLISFAISIRNGVANEWGEEEKKK
jgi:hypothetical protein